MILTRKEFLEDRCLGELLLPDGTKFYTLEDTDRNIEETDSNIEISKVKVSKKTAIPYGTYRVILSYSIKLKRYLPLLLDVPKFRGIRIHKGSSPEYSSGCLLVGKRRIGNKLSKIVEAEQELISILDSINKTHAIYITIRKDGL